MAVFGGTIMAAITGTLLVPVFFALVQGLAPAHVQAPALDRGTAQAGRDQAEAGRKRQSLFRVGRQVGWPEAPA